MDEAKLRPLGQRESGLAEDVLVPAPGKGRIAEETPFFRDMGWSRGYHRVWWIIPLLMIAAIVVDMLPEHSDARDTGHDKG